MTVDGGGGNDTLSILNGGSYDSSFTIEEVAGSVLIEGSNFQVVTDGIEDLNLSLSVGDDSVVIGDLSATDIDPDTVSIYGGSGDDFIIGSGEIPVNQLFYDDQEEPAIAGLTGGNIVVAWEEDNPLDGSYEGVFARIIDPDGVPVGDQFQVNTFFTGDQDDPKIVALSDGGFVVVWESFLQDSSSNGIFGQRFDASGTKVGSEFQVNSFVTNNQDTASVAALADGGFIVTWESFSQELSGTSGNNGIFGQRFEVSGTTPTAVGGEFQINTETAGAQDNGAVAGLADVGSGGGFVATWSSYGQDSSYDGVFAQVFDSAGDAVGSEFQVNTATGEDQDDPSVAGLDDGGFVVVWRSEIQDGSSDGIFGQRFDAAGTAVGVEFQVNTETFNDQDDPEVTLLADGSFVVAWESDDQDGEIRGVFAQRFDVTGTTPTPIGAEFQVNTNVASDQNDSDITALANGGFALAWETLATRADPYAEDVRLQIFDQYGDAQLAAATGSLVLGGGSGNDVLNGGADDDELDGFLGDDTLFGDGGDDALFGGTGFDTLDGGAGNDIIDGGEGILVDYDDIEIDTVTFTQATSGIDVNLSSERVNVDGQGGSDDIYEIEKVIGTDYNDLIRGDYADNTLVGGAGGDSLYGNGGADLLDGGLGDDTLYGGYGEDVVLGGGGNDRIYDSGTSADTLDGGDGNDNLGAEGGSNLMIGGAGDDTVSGGYGADVIIGDGDTSLLNGLGGTAGFGEDSLPRSDDSSQLVDISTIFESGLNFGGTTFSDVFINDNGNLTFGNSLSSFTPFTIDGSVSTPIIAPFFADVHTNGGVATATPGGTSTGSNLIFFDSDVANDTFTVTWDDVGYFSNNIDLLNAFQVSLVDQGAGDFDIIFRYEDMNWTTGDASGGSGGLGGTVARAGVSAANASDFFELTQSGNQTDMLGLDDIGSFTFEFRSGILVSSSSFSGGNDTLSGGAGDDTIDGGGGNDVMQGGFGNDTLDGGAGNDVMEGGAQNDILFGEAGDDTLDGGLGNDVLYGGDGVDTAAFSSSASGVTVDLAAGTANGGATDVDQLSGIENVAGSSFGDTIFGNSGDNTLDGGFGNDSLSGGGGNDVLDGGDGEDFVVFDNATAGVTVDLASFSVSDDGEGGSDTLINIENVYGTDFGDVISGDSGDNVLFGQGGNDSLDGGAGNDAFYGGDGNDTVTFSGATSGIYVQFYSQLVSDDGQGGVDSIFGIETVIGTDYNDIFIGEYNDNTVFGGGGNDLLSGQVGEDFLDGGLGNDGLYGGSDNDILLGGDGDDLLEGEIGDDFLDGGLGNDILLGGNQYDALYGGAGDDDLDGGNQNDFLDGGIGNDTLFGGTQNDVLLGGDGDDDLDGGDGDDSLDGGAGNDTLYGGFENDVLLGGDGDDSLDGGFNDDVLNGGAGNDSLYGRNNIDTLDGGDGDDFLDGGSQNDILDGGLGNDTLEGGFGNDTLLGGDGDDDLSGGADYDVLDGGAGNDTLEGGEGNDTLIGGDGIDTAVFVGETSGVNVELGGGTASGVNTGFDLISGVENIIGTGSNDHIIGDALSNVLNGADGDDAVGGGGGNDTLDGGAGNDYADFYHAAGGVVVDLSTYSASVDGDGGSDTLINFENVYGSNFDDEIYGDGGDNILKGFDGADTLDGGIGNDRLEGGDGNDRLTDSDGSNLLYGDGGDDYLLSNYTTANLYGGDGNDTLIMNYSSGAAYGGDDDDILRVYDTSGDEFNADFHGDAGNDLLYGGYGNDFLDGGADNDDLVGYEGNDELSGGSGDDTLDGGGGDDTLFGGIGNDTLIDGDGADRLYGNDGDDLLIHTTDASQDYFYGDGGNDTITFANSTGAVQVDLSTGYAFDGSDQDYVLTIENVVGSNYADTLSGDTLANTLEGGAGNDTLDGSTGTDLLDGGAGNDYLDGGASDDVLIGGDGDDNLVDGDGNDLLDGGAGNDTLYGGFNNDTLLGGDGDDDLDGHFNDDTLDGGAGNDTLYGGFNNDVLFGGDGNDFLDGGFNDDVLDGGAGNDTLFGGNNYDVLFGGDGDDILDGGNNNDTLYGGAGNDFIDGGSGYDVIHSGLGNDTIVGGSGYDTLTFTNATAGVDVALSTNTVADDGFGGFDTVSEIEIVIGSAYGDVIVGDVGNTLDGGLGNDTLIGSDGDDVLIGGDDDDFLSGASGTDSLDGGAGNDEIDIGRLNFIEGGLGDDTFNLEFEYDAAIISDVGGSDTLLLETATDGLLTVDPTSFLMFIEDGILNVETDDEDVHGILVDNFLTTGAIESFEFESVGITPFLFATAGTSGNDLLIGVEDTTVLAGGDGNDVIHAGDAEGVDLTGNAGDDFLIGSEDFFTTLDGGTGDDVLRSLGGSVGGEGAANVLIGGIGNDTLIAGGSNDLLQGGADNDTYVFDFSEGSINATISDGSGTDTLLLNSGIDFPTFISPGVTDLFLGFSEPSGGSSFIQVINQTTNGIEFITADLGDGSATTFVVQTGTAGTTNNDVLVGSPFANETLTGDDGADILFGNGGTDTILGGAGNDFIQGGADNDIIDGGADIDTFDISNATSAVVVDLTDTIAQTLGGGLGVDTLSSIENVRGSSFTDTIIGSDDDNTIDGGDGDDLISGGDGNDTFVFGSFDGSGIVHFDDSAGSNDTLILGTTGEDTLAVDFEFFKSGNDLQIDFIAGGNPTGEQAFVTDQFTGPKIVENFVFSENPGVTYVAQDSATSGNDLIVAANSAVDTTITGGDGDDALFGGIANDLLQGDGGNDALVGGDGNDVLEGGAGNDDLVGGAGNDIMDGGLGDDFFTVGEGDNTILDTILDSGGVDSVEMAFNVGLSNAKRVGNDLELTMSSGAKASIDNHFAGQAIEFVEEGFDQSIFLVSTGTDGTIAEDLIAGGGDNDTLSGFAEHDHLYGNDGDDILIGGGERDLLEGGAGSDIFRFLDPSDGTTVDDGVVSDPFFDGDFIADFTTGVDKFQFDAAAFGFGSPVSLVLDTNFFFEANFTGTTSGTPTGAYIVFDTVKNTLIADESQGVDGYTVVADVGTSVEITDVELI